MSANTIAFVSSSSIMASFCISSLFFSSNELNSGCTETLYIKMTHYWYNLYKILWQYKNILTISYNRYLRSKLMIAYLWKGIVPNCDVTPEQILRLECSWHWDNCCIFNYTLHIKTQPNRGNYFFWDIFIYSRFMLNVWICFLDMDLSTVKWISQTYSQCMSFPVSPSVVYIPLCQWTQPK